MATKPEKSFAQKLRFRLTLLIMGVMIPAAVFIYLIYQYGNTPAGQSREGVVVEITPGMTLKQVSQLLGDKNLLNEPSTFVLYTYLQGKQNKIKIGEYRFSPSTPPWKILEALTKGDTVLYIVTIPEGYRITEIAALLENKGLVTKSEFIEETRNKELLDSLKIPTENLEGYLYPETYKFPKNAGARKIVKTLFDTFKERVQIADLEKRAQAIQFTVHEVITLASLIEKETGMKTERRLISSVFHNRLAKKMRLQTDPTVIYAMADFDGNIRKKDLSIDSPYNTYKYFGLPPGPIASPGLESIEAALNPENTNFLYFVSRKDGSHQFSTNYKDHTKAVQQYQLSPKARG